MKKRKPADSDIIFDGSVIVPESIHSEYIAFGNTINVDSYDYNSVLKESDNALFDSQIPEELKKKLIYLLGHFATAESYNILKKYIDSPDAALLHWATLALQELRFAVENDMYDGSRDMIMSPSGGKGTSIRYYTAFSSNKGRPLTENQKRSINNDLLTCMKRFHSEIKNISFGNTYCLATLLIPMTVAPQTPIDAFLDIAGTKKQILRYHFMITNIQPFSPEEINDYLTLLK